MSTIPNKKNYPKTFVSAQLVFTIMGLLFSNNLFSEEINFESKLKQEYLYNFTKFIDWPQKDSPTFNLCIIGNNPFGDALKSIEQKTALGKTIRLFYYPHLKKSFQHCDIIYFSTLIGVKFLQDKRFYGILTVGESKDFVRHGGMLGFVRKNNEIKLQINVQNIKKNGLEVSGKLIEVSEIIGDYNE